MIELKVHESRVDVVAAGTTLPLIAELSLAVAATAQRLAPVTEMPSDTLTELVFQGVRHELQTLAKAPDAPPATGK